MTKSIIMLAFIGHFVILSALMLLGFKVSNFLSFRDPVEFSAIGSQEQQHSERVTRDRFTGHKLLPIAVLCGPNASGKTNFVRALDFAKKLVTSGTKPEDKISVHPFKLDETLTQAPSEFSFTLYTSYKTYSYGFKVSSERVHEEWLEEITKTSSKRIFHRNTAGKFDLSFFKTRLPEKEFDFVEFVSKGTRLNQLFLTEAAEKNLEHFQDVYRWFKHTLRIIKPTTWSGSLGPSIVRKDSFHNFLNIVLTNLETGIEAIDVEETPLEALGISGSMKEDLKSELREGASRTIRFFDGERITVTNTAGQLQAFKLVSRHKTIQNEVVKFDLTEESEGTRRLIELLPAFHQMADNNQERVFIIDELDRSLHSLVTVALVELFLLSRQSTSLAQLIFTTHNLQLLDQNLFRRDEMWFFERDNNSSSRLTSLSDFRGVRSDKSIVNDYLVGRFGGVPKLDDFVRKVLEQMK